MYLTGGGGRGVAGRRADYLQRRSGTARAALSAPYSPFSSRNFWATVCKTVRLCYRTVVLSVCPVCDVGALWPNGWMDQDETWHAGRPRSWPHCVRTQLPVPQRGTARQFSARICCGQMPLGTEVGLGPGDFVLDGDPHSAVWPQ